MPLLITPDPAAPLVAGNRLPVASAYAIILETHYLTRDRVIRFKIGYYANEAAYLDNVDELNVAQQYFPRWLTQPATAQEANAVPIFQFMEGLLTQTLTGLLGGATTIKNVA